MNNILYTILAGILLSASCVRVSAMEPNQNAQSDKSAANNNAIASLQALLKNLKDNAMYEEKHSKDIALIHASHRGHTRDVVKLIENGADVNYLSKGGLLTPLIAAAEGTTHEEISRILIKAGCRVNDTNKNGETALHIAVQNESPYRGNLEFLLLHAKADLNQTCNQGKTALCYAATNFDTTCFLLKHLLRVTIYEVDSVKNWLLLTLKMRNDLKINLPPDIRRHIAHSICRSLAEDLHANIIGAGGAKALELVQEKVEAHEELWSKYGATLSDPKLAEKIELTKQLEECLDIDKLTEFTHRMTLLPKRAQPEIEEKKPKGWKCIVM
jgi:hypothetical protein